MFCYKIKSKVKSRLIKHFIEIKYRKEIKRTHDINCANKVIYMIKILDRDFLKNLHFFLLISPLLIFFYRICPPFATVIFGNPTSNCYRLTLDTKTITANVLYKRCKRSNVEHSVLFMILIKRNEKRSRRCNCWNCRGTIYIFVVACRQYILFTEREKRDKRRDISCTTAYLFFNIEQAARTHHQYRF